jgi:SAM-dependent methyltransferase
MFTARDREKCERLFNRYYAGRKFYDVLYRERIRKLLHPGARVLDAGCGRTLPLCHEFSCTGRMVGIDLESTIETDNREQPFGVRGDLRFLPFADGSFDMVVSRSVIEHLSNPEPVFREFARVLRPGGLVVFVTPNKWDYVSLFAAMTPHWFHQWIVSRACGASEDDVFPTFYRANTPSALRKATASSGLREKQITSIAHYPAYLSFSPILFRLGVLYERMTLLECFSWLRGSLLCVFERTAAATGRAGNDTSRARAPLGVS